MISRMLLCVNAATTQTMFGIFVVPAQALVDNGLQSVLFFGTQRAITPL